VHDRRWGAAAGIGLFLVGAAMVVLGIFAEPREAVAVALVVLGAGLMVISAVLHRIESFELGLSGAKATLAQIGREEAEKLGTPPEVGEAVAQKLGEELRVARPPPGSGALSQLLLRKRREAREAYEEDESLSAIREQVREDIVRLMRDLRNQVPPGGKP
jgi:hypothetical protein